MNPLIHTFHRYERSVHALQAPQPGTAAPAQQEPSPRPAPQRRSLAPRSGYVDALVAVAFVAALVQFSGGLHADPGRHAPAAPAGICSP